MATNVPKRENETILVFINSILFCTSYASILTQVGLKLQVFSLLLFFFRIFRNLLLIVIALLAAKKLEFYSFQINYLNLSEFLGAYRIYVSPPPPAFSFLTSYFNFHRIFFLAFLFFFLEGGFCYLFFFHRSWII